MASLLNGFREMGASVADYAGRLGLQEQKEQLARQTLELADNMARSRGSFERQESAGIAKEQSILTDALTGGRADRARVADAEIAGTARRDTAQLTSTENKRQEVVRGEEAEKTRTATMSLEKAREQAALERKMLEINAPPEVIKTLRELGQLPASTSAAPSSRSSSQDDGVALTPDKSVTDSAASLPSKGPDVNNPLIAKALGLPMAGSEAAVRQAIADDVKKDPVFKYKTLGEQAIEIEQRLALSKKTDLTERQGKSALFADRMFEANNVFNDVMKADPGGNTWLQRRLYKIGSFTDTTGLNTSNFQRMQRAEEDFLTAILRDESGALIGEPEFIRDQRKYFPQPGDEPPVIADKARARELAVKGLAREAGSTYKTPERPGSAKDEKGADKLPDPLGIR